MTPKKSKSKLNDAPVNVGTFYYFYIILFLTMPFGFVLRLIFTKSLDASQVGLMYSFTGLFGLLTLFVNLGFAYSMQYFIARQLVKKQYDKIRFQVWITIALQATLTLLFGALLYLNLDWLASDFFKFNFTTAIFSAFFLYFLSINLTRTLTDVLVALNKVVYSQSIYLGQMILLVGATAISWYFGRNDPTYYAYFWGISLFIGMLAALVAVRIFAPWLFEWPKFLWKDYWAFFKNAVFAFVANISFSLLTKVDVIMITYFLTLTYVADYTNALAITDALVSLFSAVAIVLIPYVSAWNVKREFDKVHQLLSVIYDLFIFIAAPVMLTVALFPEQIVTSLYGPAYAHIYGLLALLSVGVLIRVLIQFNISCIIGLGLTKKLYLFVIPAVIINIVLNFVLIKSLGLAGVAIATIISWIIILAATLHLVRTKIKRIVHLASLYKTCILLFVFVAGVEAFKLLPIGNYYVLALVSLALSYAIYMVLGYMWNIYSISRLYVFVPKSIVPKVEHYHKTYLGFLK